MGVLDVGVCLGLSFSEDEEEDGTRKLGDDAGGEGLGDGLEECDGLAFSFLSDECIKPRLCAIL